MMDTGNFRQTLDRHGANLEDWPQPARARALEFLTGNEAARALLARQKELEAVLGRLPAPFLPQLETRVLTQPLPPRQLPLLDRILAWLLPTSDRTLRLWRPALAACLPLIFGLVLGNYFSFGVVAEEQDVWNWSDELVMLSLVSPEEPQALP